MEATMAAAVKITRMDHTAEALRGFAAKSTDGAQVRRLLALAVGRITGCGKRQIQYHEQRTWSGGDRNINCGSSGFFRSLLRRETTVSKVDAV